MGNSQSDLGEQEAWGYIKNIPFINVAYAPIRAMVYAGKDNKKEADRSRLDFASAIGENATMFIPGVGAAMKGAIVATKIAATAGVGLVGGAAQGGIEYGVDKGRDMVDDGEMHFDPDGIKEAQKFAQYVPGVNLIVAGVGDEVEPSTWVDNALTTASWLVPAPTDFKKVRQCVRKPDPWIPNNAGGEALRGKGKAIRSRATPLAVAENVVLPAGFNLPGHAVEDMAARATKIAKLPESVVFDKDATEPDGIVSGSTHSTAENDPDDEQSRPYDRLLPKYVQVLGENKNAIAMVAVIALVAGSGWYLYRWWKPNRTEEKDSGGDSKDTSGDERKALSS